MAAVEEGIEVRAFLKKCWARVKEKKCSNVLVPVPTIPPKMPSPSILGRQLKRALKYGHFWKNVGARVRDKKCVSDGCHVHSTVPCHCLHRTVYQTKPGNVGRLKSLNFFKKFEILKFITNS
jgi:hypothetical protein